MFLKFALAAAILANNGVFAVVHWSQTTKMLAKGTQDQLLSLNKASRAGWFESGYFQLTYLRDVTGVMRLGDATGVIVGIGGRLLVHNPREVMAFGALPKICNNNAPGVWQLQVTNDARFRTFSNCGTIGWDSGFSAHSNPFWGIRDIMDVNYELTPGRLNKSAGLGTYIYYIDNGLLNTIDMRTQPLAFLMTNPDLGVSNSFHGQILSKADHGTTMAGVANSDAYGIAQGAGSGMIQVARRWTKEGPLVAERDIIRAFQWIFQNPGVNNGRQVIINLSVAFDDGLYTDALSCATQWAYHRRAYVVAGAGNSNLARHWFNPYVLMVSGYLRNLSGAGCSPISGGVNYGNMVDLWAPATLATYSGFAGSSLPAALTSAAVAIAVSRWPLQLKNNPNRGYRYLADLADRHRLCPNDPKVKASQRAGLKTLSLKRLATVPAAANYFVDATAPDYCGRLGLNKFVPNWPALVQKSALNRIGRLVGKPTSFATNCFFCHVF